MPINFSNHHFAPVIVLPRDYEVFDFTRDDNFDPFRSVTSTFSVGKYNEKRRNVYTTKLFTESARDIHMGVDIGAPVGTAVHAFHDGEIFLQGYNAAAGDYGYTIITRHVIDETELFALHGHLSKSSIQLRKENDSFRAADLIATLGARDENGGWNPHLHFQLSYEKPAKPDLPGVVNEAEREHALRIYPDPQLVLGTLY